TASVLGVRESRRAVGEYVLTGADVTGLARFPDAVAAGAWPQEYHVAGRSTEYVPLPEGGFYQVPLRSLRPVGLANLRVTARCATRSVPSAAGWPASASAAETASRSWPPTTGSSS